MADVKNAGKGAADTEKKANTRKAHKGLAKRRAAQRVGAKGAWITIDQPTPAKASQALIANGRSALSTGRKPRAAPDVNTVAFKPIHAAYMKLAAQFEERGLSKVSVQGAELVCEQLAIAAEVDSYSPRVASAVAWTDQMAYVHKLRDSITRLHPGPGADNTALRAKFGLHKQVRVNQPHTLANAAKALLVGKKALPGTRAAKLIIASDEKQLRAIAQAVPKTTAEHQKVRAEAVSRIANRDILNTALELFYDDFAATAGAVLAGDEVARLHALQLIPRRPEQRAEKEKSGEGGTGSGEGAAPPVTQELVKQ